MLIYADVVMAINFFVDFLLILGTNRITGKLHGTGRAAIGSLIGGVYSGLCLIPWLSFLSGVLCRALMLCSMCIVSFGINRGTLRRSVMFLILSMTLGGLALGIGDGSITAVLGCCAGLYLVIRSGILDLSGKKYIEVELHYQGTSRKITALLDTGNMLRDPISGDSVLVVSADIAKEMFGISQEQLSDPVKALSELRILGMRILPYHCVGNRGGMLLALRMDRVRLNGVDSSKLVAFAPEIIGGSDFQALAGGVI